MNRTLKITIVMGVVLLAVVGAALIIRHHMENQIMDGPGMINDNYFDFSETYLSRVYYYYGGSELGDSYSVELTIEEDDNGDPDVRVAYYNQPSHDSKAKEKTVRVSPEVITGVQEIIDRYHMTEWTDLPKSDIFALDAPSTSFSYEYSDGTQYRLKDDDEWPEGAGTAIREILDYILSSAGITEE